MASPRVSKLGRPYYEDEWATIYHADALEVTVEGASVLVTDPPYGIDYKSNQRRSVLADSIEGDGDTTRRDAVLKAWGPVLPALVFGTWRIPRPAGTRMVLVWDTKGALGMGDTSTPWKPSHQEIYVLGRGFTGHRGTDVLCYAPVQSMSRNGRVHPHQKPVALMQDLISKCPPGLILDPFMGSGSTLCAAKNLGRRSVGIEIDEGYCELAAERLQGRNPVRFPNQEGLAV